MSEMKKVFSIPEDAETKVWRNKYRSVYELLDNLKCTVQHAGLYHGEV